jgi:hypothetical protein
MADLAARKVATVAAAVTTLGLAAAGCAAGANAGTSPSPSMSARPSASKMAHSTSHARSMSHTGAGMGHHTTHRSGMGKDGMGHGQMGTGGMGAPGAPGLLRLHGMPAGTVRVWRDTQGKLKARLHLLGLTPGSAHTAAIDGPHGGALSPEVRFGAFKANSMGQANVTLTAARKAGALAGGSRFDVRLGAYRGAAGNPAAKELISGSSVLAAQPRGNPVPMHPRSYGPTGSYLGRLHGWAMVTYHPGAHTLAVTLTAYGLPPGAHAAHIHLGSCGSQGAVKYMLMDFRANAHGDVVNQTRMVKGVTSAPPAHGWYLNVHLGTSNNILSNGMPTISFRPELCANLTGMQSAGHM